ncbi:hypothetical protein [Kineosporia sp. NBRC 101731]|uniref:hypothetical protein n=1 Tax=Kineosporia sp. NBRC 101731 TaxID=3032199 RepID=UPI0024A560D4|nr:hypothetical protein [Kineosporia sp. NBRC 101731]GLY31998.1 hypothetical protein Kisp02_53630 [Kineosporia sp. NBRC 101731]
MSNDYRHGLNITALVESGSDRSYPDDPTQARQWAHLLPSGEYRIDGDQNWTRDGRGLEAKNWDRPQELVFPEGTRIVHRDISIGYGPWVDQETGAAAAAAKSFDLKIGDTVRVVGCTTAAHVGLVGKLMDNPEHDGPTVDLGDQFAGTTDGGPCWADEVAPVWQVGEGVTEEPPIGTTVRVGHGYFRRGTDGSWFDLSDMNRYSWADLLAMATTNGVDVIYVSDSEARPTFVVGEVVTPEMGEPPVGSAVKDRDGDLWTHRATWVSAGSTLTGWSSAKGYGPLTLVSLPDQPTESHAPQPKSQEVPTGGIPDATVAEDGPPIHDDVKQGDKVTITGTVASVGKHSGLPGFWVDDVDHSRQEIHVTDRKVSIARPSTAEAREVPLSEMRDGDVVSASFVFRSDRTDEGHWSDGLLAADAAGGWLVLQEASATRPIKALPTTPGKAVLATIRYPSGQEFNRVIGLDQSGQWYEILDREPVNVDQVLDFVKLLAGEER